MTLLEQVHRKHEALASVLKDHAGIRRTVEDLYPDSAHFIYELLQNAEDTAATEAHFILHKGALVFEHNGRPFSDGDVWAITDIGEGTKARDDDKIGRFGLGFKAVFVYTETPRIWSPTYSFEISELVLPRAIAAEASIGARTRFEFPFNNHKKTPDEAYSEVLAGLSQLAETTLLFLRHLESIAWCVESSASEVLRVVHGEHHIEILKQTDGATTSTSHYLRFSQPVHGMETQQVAVAFELAVLQESGRFEPAKALGIQMRVFPANPGRVAVFFPAEKETSGLRFHLHAPFVPELSRASIKDTPANDPLVAQLAELTASALHQIRDLGLLTGEFIGVLPNPQDTIPKRYEPIRTAIVAEMNEQPLVPTHARGFAPANTLLQGRASLKDLLTEDDLSAFGPASDGRFQWALSATQRNNNADRFLAGLAIAKWDVEELVDILRLRCSIQFVSVRGRSAQRPDPVFMTWLQTKSDVWHQQLYAMLFQELGATGNFDEFKTLKIVQRSDGSHGTGATTFFPTEGASDNEALPRVAETVYGSGRSKTQQEAARKFLEAIGVRTIGEADEVAALLEQRYSAGAVSGRNKDLRRFVKLVETQPSEARRFDRYCIFENASGVWVKPSAVYLDAPMQRTGLGLYFGALGDKAPRKPLAPRYAQLDMDAARLAAFCAAVGVATRLAVTEVSCFKNPQWAYLSSVEGERFTSPLDRDFTITHLDGLLLTPSLELSGLVWNTMCGLLPHFLKARYQKSERHGYRVADSFLVHVLREGAWVPQANAKFVRPSEAVREELPPGFPFDAAQEWLTSVRFGEESLRRVDESAQRQKTAKEFGFEDSTSLDDARLFAALPPTVRARLLDEGRQAVAAEADFPDHEPRNPERRAERVGAAAEGAPERITEMRLRSIAAGYPSVMEEAGEYLVDQYTNVDGELICQVCKTRMPFRLADGAFYFESVEFLPELERRHYQNYLALCPNHAAMFKHANGSRELMKDMLCQLDEPVLEVVLAQLDMTIRFTGTHLADLRRIIAVDEASVET